MSTLPRYIAKHAALVARAGQYPLDFSMIEVWDALKEAEAYIQRLEQTFANLRSPDITRPD